MAGVRGGSQECGLLSDCLRVPDVNKQWSGCKELPHWVKSGCAAEPAPQRLNFGDAGNAGIIVQGRLQPALFYDSLRYPLLLIFPPDRVEVPGNAGRVHREAQDFKKQVHRLHPNRRSERCPQADSAADKILPYTPQRGYLTPVLEWCPFAWMTGHDRDMSWS